jgi:hypothetical protein
VPHELEVGVLEEAGDVLLATGVEVVKADDFVPLVEETFTKMGAEESGSAGDEDAPGGGIGASFLVLSSWEGCGEDEPRRERMKRTFQKW